MEFATSTEMNVADVSRSPNSSVRGTTEHPSEKHHHRCNEHNAIWTLEPIAMAMAKSILSFPATITAAKCSAALPKNGQEDHADEEFWHAPSSSTADPRGCEPARAPSNRPGRWKAMSKVHASLMAHRRVFVRPVACFGCKHIHVRFQLKQKGQSRR